jgi:hypothetical protein
MERNSYRKRNGKSKTSILKKKSYIKYQVKNQILQKIISYHFGLCHNTLTKSIVTLHYTWAPRPTHK